MNSHLRKWRNCKRNLHAALHDAQKKDYEEIRERVERYVYSRNIRDATHLQKNVTA